MTAYRAICLDTLDKVLIVLIGIVMSLSAVVLFEQSFTGDGVDTFLPWLWPPLFALSGLSCFNFVFQPTCRVAYSLSGSLTAGAFFARAVQFTYYLFEYFDNPVLRTHVSLDIGAYLSAMVLVILSWRRLSRRAPHDSRLDPISLSGCGEPTRLH